jgi:spectinomycin phosphotransferase
VGLDVPGRRHLESALTELDRTWLGGPFAEPGRHVVAEHASDVAELLALADRLAADVARRGAKHVITHGEPHAANVMRGGHRIALIDWDTVGLAPPERDLWMVVGEDGEGAAAYADATGHRIDPDAISFFRLAWDLDDTAAFITELRSPHSDNEDTRHAFEALTYCVSVRDRWASLIDEHRS